MLQGNKVARLYLYVSIIYRIFTPLFKANDEAIMDCKKHNIRINEVEVTSITALKLNNYILNVSKSPAK